MLYGFNTKDLAAIAGVSSADLTNLGHVIAGTTIPTGKVIVLGARSPKPPRVTKKIANAGVGAQQSISTFCAFDKLTQALAAGWKLSTQRRGVSLRPETSAKNSLTAIAELSDGSLYCFPMNKADFSTYGASLGLKSPTTITTATERGKLVSGSSIPRPGNASLEVSGGTFSSFYSTDAKDTASTAGFAILTDEVVITTGPAPTT
ncbi:hypothetical protein NIES2101_23955 [Calothrix sp. HK-06]|nr:hypothetical protein NIES2101_23820 [Calothrix sp. HK-06]OKH47322.1 hypothetical protein NIES2101_23955 [Calothrix sp. HK-06]